MGAGVAITPGDFVEEFETFTGSGEDQLNNLRDEVSNLKKGGSDGTALGLAVGANIRSLGVVGLKLQHAVRLYTELAPSPVC